MLKFDVTLKTS